MHAGKLKEKNMNIFLCILKVIEERVGSGVGPKSTAGSDSQSQGYGFADPNSDPQQNVTEPQHCFAEL